MNKMKAPEMEVVRFGAEDILTTSCTSFSAYSAHYIIKDTTYEGQPGAQTLTGFTYAEYLWNGEPFENEKAAWEATSAPVAGKIEGGYYYTADGIKLDTTVGIFENQVFLKPHMGSIATVDEGSHNFPLKDFSTN